MNCSSRPTLCIVVLAAGLSVRLGRPKALARVHGISLIRSTVHALPRTADTELIVVIPPRAARARAELHGRRVSFVENRRRTDGLSSSIRCGLRAARAGAGVLLVPVDLAHLERRDLERMVKRWLGARRRVVARRMGAHGGAPLILPRRLCRLADDIHGDEGLKDRIARLPREQRVLIEIPSAQIDVDTREDLVRARTRRLRGRRYPRGGCTRR